MRFRIGKVGRKLFHGYYSSWHVICLGHLFALGSAFLRTVSKRGRGICSGGSSKSEQYYVALFSCMMLLKE